MTTFICFNINVNSLLSKPRFRDRINNYNVEHDSIVRTRDCENTTTVETLAAVQRTRLFSF